MGPVLFAWMVIAGAQAAVPGELPSRFVLAGAPLADAAEDWRSFEDTELTTTVRVERPVRSALLGVLAGVLAAPGSVLIGMDVGEHLGSDNCAFSGTPFCGSGALGTVGHLLGPALVLHGGVALALAVEGRSR